MAHILEGQVLINNVDIWTGYGVFLTEDKKGDRENLNAILAPSKTKEHVGVDLRERHGKQYSANLLVKNEEREVTLYFALYATSRNEWLTRYFNFINFLKSGDHGWLTVNFPTLLNMELRMIFSNATRPKVLTHLWLGDASVQAGKFKVTFREPNPII